MSQRRLGPVQWLTIVLGGTALGMIPVLTPRDAEALRFEAHTTGTTGLSDPMFIPIPEPAIDSPLQQKPQLPVSSATRPAAAWREATVKAGDSLSRLFAKAGVSAAQLLAILELDTPARYLRVLRPGQTLRLRVDDDERLLELEHDVDKVTTLHVWRVGEGFRASVVEKPVQREVVRAARVIDRSLFDAAQRAGLPDRLTMQLVKIFGWDIDFALDIHAGDEFRVVYERRYVDGEHVDDGPILAAEFVNQGTRYQAIRYTDRDGRSTYYTPQGRCMRKTFLRTPVNFERISSPFSASRVHPILHQHRAHKGVDYAAPTGTPVRATADGTIDTVGYQGGYGKRVIIQHGVHYSTLYGHLSRFAAGLHAGSAVRQGQVIGYVGQSGLATGPHLHYEFRIDGIHRDPLTVKLPNADPIEPAEAAEFGRQSGALLARLEAPGQTTLAHQTR